MNLIYRFKKILIMIKKIINKRRRKKRKRKRRIKRKRKRRIRIKTRRRRRKIFFCISFMNNFNNIDLI